tara:strand:+ start:5047 stop:6462 length:1416 start_codon:yes stop_codon:yes gene_type:complete
MHLGGFDLVTEFTLAAFFPKLNSDILISLFYRISETIFIAFTSWFISIIFGIFFGLLSSDIFYKSFNIPNIFGKLVKLFLTFFRSIHELVWGLLLIQIYGLNLKVGIISICIPYIAINAKVFKEQLDNINIRNIESILAINNRGLSSLITITWLPIVNTLYDFGIYRLECALRSTSILGLFGLGGIGTSIYLSFKALSFRELWTYLWTLGLLIIFAKIIFNLIKYIKINSKFLILIFSLLLFLSISLVFYLIYFILSPSYEFTYSVNNFHILTRDFINYDFLKLIIETILLSISATALAISLPPFCSILINNNFGLLLMGFISFCFRLIPPPITILVLLMFNEPSISLAALSLGLYNAAITSKLMNANLREIKKNQFIALESIGASKRISWLLGLFSIQAKSYLGYCAYRSDILIRETAIVGVIGSVGLGWQLQESISSFAWDEVSLILIAYSSIAIIGELINGKIKEKFV